MKVFQVFESYPLFYQPYIPPVIDALCKKNGLDIKIVAFKGKSEKANEAIVLPKYNVRRTIVKTSRLLNKQYRDLDYLEITALKEKVAIIHLQHSFLFKKVINLLKRPPENRPKIIITLRGGDTYVKPWLDHRWTNFYNDYGNKVDAFITMSEHQRDYLNMKWGIDKKRIHIVPISFGNEVDIESKYPNQEIMRVISAFRMCWEKNIDGNLRTIKLIKEMGIPVKYEIYGDGQDVGQLYYLIDKYNLSDCVFYLGRIDNNDLKSILPNFDFFLQLSHSESLGLTVVEAQSLGVPVIVSNSDGLPESIIDGITAFCVDSHDINKAANEMVHLWGNRELYKQFSNEAIKFANSKFTISSEVNKLQSLYSTLVK